MTESYEIPTCAMCESEYSLNDGCEPSLLCDSCAQAVIPEMVELLKECLEAIEMEYGVCKGCTTDPCMKCRTKALLAKVQGGKRSDDSDFDEECEECGECGGEGWVTDDCFEDTCCCADPETSHGVIRCICNPPKMRASVPSAAQ